VINAKYALGRSTGNTFQQTSQDSTVLGVPIAGPNVGVTFPTEDYVAPSTTSLPAAPPRRAPARSPSSPGA